MVVGLADKMGSMIGPFGRWTFLIGFWGAVFTSMLGVWQGVPYLFADFSQHFFKNKENNENSFKKYYNYYLVYLSVLPIVLLFVAKPIWIVILYAVSGAFFMPFLAMTLLYLNNKFIANKSFKNNWITNSLLVLSLLVFVYLLIIKVLQYL